MREAKIIQAGQLSSLMRARPEIFLPSPSTPSERNSAKGKPLGSSRRLFLSHTVCGCLCQDLDRALYGSPADRTGALQPAPRVVGKKQPVGIMVLAAMSA